MPISERPRWLAYLALGVGIFSVGFSAIFVRWANAPGTVISLYRVAIAALLLAWPFYRRVRTGHELPRRGIWLAMLGGLLFAGDLALWSTGVVLSGATNPTLLANTAPVWVGLGALILFRERLGARFWIGLLLAMSGVVLILHQDSLEAPTLGLGTFLGLAAAIFYGGYFLVTQRGRESLDSLSYLWLTACSAALVLVILSLALGHSLTGYTTVAYLSFLGAGVVVQVFGWLAVNYAQGYLPASIVASTMLGQPVVTALLAVLLLGESLTLWQILGGTIVMAGVYIVHRTRSESRKAGRREGWKIRSLEIWKKS
jgi:drug/metabolite transporter (DMT)-like permease